MACFRPRWAAAWFFAGRNGVEKPGGPSKRFFHGYSGGNWNKKCQCPPPKKKLLYDDLVPWMFLGQKLEIAKYVKIIQFSRILAESLEHFIVLFVQAWPFHVGVHFVYIVLFEFATNSKCTKKHKTTTHQRKVLQMLQKMPSQFEHMPKMPKMQRHGSIKLLNVQNGRKMPNAKRKCQG